MRASAFFAAEHGPPLADLQVHRLPQGEVRGRRRPGGVLTSCGLHVAPSGYYAARNRPPSRRTVSDAVVDEHLRALREQPFNAALGSRKTWRLLNAQEPALPVARCTVERRMRALGMAGIGPGRAMRTTRPAECLRRPEDLVRRDHAASRPNQRWVADARLHPHLARGPDCTAFVTGPALAPDRGVVNLQPDGHRLRPVRSRAGRVAAQGPRAGAASPGSCTTPTTGRSTCRFATPTGS